MTIILNGTTGISGVDGSAATPAFKGNDSNTGISFGTDIVTINTGGQARVTTDASGNVGVGSTTPSGRLEVSGSSCIRWQTTDANFINEISTNPAKNAYVGRTYDASSHVWKLSSSNQMTFDSSGNLGLGVTPTSGWSGSFKVFQIAGQSALWSNGSATFVSTNNYNDGGNKYIGTGGASRYYQSGGQHIWENAPSGTAGNAISFTQAMTLDASGNLGIGTATTTYRANIVYTNSAGGIAETGLYLRNTSTGNSTQILFDGNRSWSLLAQGSFGAPAGGFTIKDNTAGVERLSIDSSGNLLVGVTATGTPAVGYIFNSNGFLQIGRASGAAQSTIGFYNGSTFVGEIRTSTTATTYATSSDYRLKENVAPMTGALATVAALKPCTYTWKTDGSAGQGFIAHELQAVVPDCVTGTKDAVDAEGKPQYQGVDTSFLVATLVSAIQEQQAIITQLQADVAALKGAA